MNALLWIAVYLYIGYSHWRLAITAGDGKDDCPKEVILWWPMLLVWDFLIWVRRRSPLSVRRDDVTTGEAP